MPCHGATESTHKAFRLRPMGIQDKKGIIPAWMLDCLLLIQDFFRPFQALLRTSPSTFLPS